jgi:hypothetical protein
MKNRTDLKSWKILVIAMVLLTLFIPGATCTKNHPSVLLHVNAALILGADYKTAGSSVCTVKIVNEDNYDWHNVKLTVDQLYVYNQKIDVLKAGETLTLPLTSYVLDGSSFDITKYKPAWQSVSCDEGTYYAGWTNRTDLAKQ